MQNHPTSYRRKMKNGKSYCNGDFEFIVHPHAVSERRETGSIPKNVHTSLNEVPLDGFRSNSVVNGVISCVSGLLTQRESCFTSRSFNTESCFTSRSKINLDPGLLALHFTLLSL